MAPILGRSAGQNSGGLDAVKSEVVRLPEPVLVVERYDRMVQAGQLTNTRLYRGATISVHALRRQTGWF
ncbi:MAG: hypothetical protein BWK73_54025 [Thiothrix lacustris]|uniref:Uncharacterized protein n=1 Tax=Thiothrix lacustris TaxID=525917 RepID=A0A1Y1Q6Z0_9GAMM|nr:MAG: hypothetical protein BWK73_54025 [Thiothrix lacustris]